MRHDHIKQIEMSATNSFESGVLRHIFLNEAITSIGDAGGLLKSVVAGSVYIALFTTDPGETGSGTEAAFGAYARVAVARDSGEWEEASGQVRNINAITFPECSSGAESITHFGICKTLAGDDVIFYGALPAPALVSIEVQIQFDVYALNINLD
jgi:hypothetical protein